MYILKRLRSKNTGVEMGCCARFNIELVLCKLTSRTCDPLMKIYTQQSLNIGFHIKENLTYGGE